MIVRSTAVQRKSRVLSRISTGLDRLSKIANAGGLYVYVFDTAVASRTNAKFLDGRLASWLIVSSLEGSCGDY